MRSPSRPVRGSARSLGLTVVLGALAACTTVGPNFSRPEPPGSPGYAMKGDPAPAGPTLTADDRVAGPWWRAFGSRDLDEVMDQALTGNQTVAVALATLEKTRDQVQAVQGALAPRIDGNAGLERERINLNQFGFTSLPNPTINLLTIGGTVGYDFDLFGGGRRRLEAARAAEEAQTQRADAAYLTLTGNVALEAMRIAQLRDQLATLQEILADDQHDIDIVRRAEAAGGEPSSATTGGQTQLALDQAMAPPLEQQLAQARHALALLVGKSPADWSAPDFRLASFSTPTQIPVSVPSALVRRRPDILAAEADLHADTARIGVATADLYPDIKLSAGIEQGGTSLLTLFDYQSTGWNLGAGLTAPIFNGGALRSQKRAAEAQARASLAQYRQTVLTAFVQVSDVMAALAHDDERLAADARVETAAQSSLTDARSAFALGGGALLPVVDAQRQLNRARLSLAEARGQRMMDMVALYAATASDWRNGAPRAAR